MHLVVDGTAYDTFGTDEPISAGMIVGIPDGRAAEVTEAPSFDGWIVVRPWDSDVRRDVRVDEVFPWIEIGA